MSQKGQLYIIKYINYNVYLHLFIRKHSSAYEPVGLYCRRH